MIESKVFAYMTSEQMQMMYNKRGKKTILMKNNWVFEFKRIRAAKNATTNTKNTKIDNKWRGL